MSFIRKRWQSTWQNLASIWIKTRNMVKSFALKKKKKTTKWYLKTYQYRKSVISSFPHERKWICPGISVTSCSNSPTKSTDLAQSVLQRSFVKTSFRLGRMSPNVNTQRRLILKINLTLPCGGTLEGRLHSHLHWRAMPSFLQDTWNEGTFYSSRLWIDNHWEPC